MSSVAVKSTRKKQSMPKWMEALCYAVIAAALIMAGMCIFVFFNGKTEQTTPIVSQAQMQPVKEVKKDISDATLVKVSTHLKNKFRVGDWRYGGVEQKNGIVRAYIQIPEKLNFSKSQLKSYVRGRVCPVNEHALWQDLARKQLEVHLFVSTKAASDVTRCG